MIALWGDVFPLEKRHAEKRAKSVPKPVLKAVLKTALGAIFGPPRVSLVLMFSVVFWCLGVGGTLPRAGVTPPIPCSTRWWPKVATKCGEGNLAIASAMGVSQPKISQ